MKIKRLGLLGLACSLFLSVYMSTDVFAKCSRVERQELAKQVVEHAKQGRVPDSEFGLGAKWDDVVAKLGEPTNTEEDGLVCEYSNQGTNTKLVFALKEDKTVMAVAMTNPKFKQLRQSDFDKLLGKPSNWGLYVLDNCVFGFADDMVVVVSKDALE